MAAGDQVAVPPQHGVRLHQQPYSVQHVAWQAAEQSRQQRPVARFKSDSLPAQLPFKYRDLMAQGQDLHVPVVVAHRQQTQHRERVGHAQVRQSQQHDPSA
ncbi:hypothetical protein ACIGXM_21225 [Kitasatospora sp. NPDC052896]|uniref:hypothetical protein n=1 Tax=Kitasatospora sp. NPDC052896 TaxID=3364061 RepID=UPI0037C6A9FB